MPVLACQPVRRAVSISRCSRVSIAVTRSGSRSWAGIHGSTRSRKRTSVAQKVPTPASTRWSSRVSPTNRSDAVTRAAATAASQSGPRMSGPRWPTRSDSRLVGTRSSMPSRRPNADQVSVSTAARRSWRRSTRSVRAPGCSTRHWPSIRRWVCRVAPVSNRCRRCLPRATTSRVRDPDRSTSGTDGQRSSARSTTASRRAASSRSAVRCTVSPSGTADHLRIRSPRGVRWKPASSRADTTGWPDPSSWPPSAFSTVMRPRLPRRTASARAVAAARSRSGWSE